MRIASIIGARPQFIKLAVICHALKNVPDINHLVVHTGQHYDDGMSAVFFRELCIPAPEHNLAVGSGGHAVQTGEMMKLLEPLLDSYRPDWVLLYGDTNSTVAGALTAAKLGISSAHVEAGLRSYNRSMPEEINRVVTDHLCDLLFCPTETAVQNLQREGLDGGAVLTGDVMYDALLLFRPATDKPFSPALEKWRSGTFALATVHRAGNTDDPVRLRGVMDILERIAREVCPVVMPLHPRTHQRLNAMKITPRAIRVIPPVSYREMLMLESRARFIITDSGGVQKEAYLAHIPCITLREETEWRETLANDCNVLVGCDGSLAMRAIASIDTAGPWLEPYGKGDSASRMLGALAARQAIGRVVAGS